MRLLARPGVVIGLSLWLAAALIWLFCPTSPSHTLAQAVPVPADTTNPYWAGYVATKGGPFTKVEASWIVPAAGCSSQLGATSTAYAWIGEGGYLQGLASPLIQAGTGSTCQEGLPQYHAFYEWYPGIYATDFPVTLRPGDRVTVSLREPQPDYWLLSIRDDTTGQGSTTATYFHADAGSADFVVERPTVCNGSGCNQVPLAPFGTVTFSDIEANGALGNAVRAPAAATPIALVEPATGDLLAVPGRADRGTLSVLWRRQI